jgi:hypothetical protein
MKIHIRRMLVLLFILGVIAPGCKKDFKIKTKINPDGSCERIVIVKEAKKLSDVKDVAFPVPIDTSWTIRFEKLAGDTQSSFIAQKTFSDVNQLNNEYMKEGKVRLEIKFEKRFRWFFTYFTYQETYKWFFPFQHISLSSFLTPEEYASYKKDDTSKALQKRLEEFKFENIFEEFFSQLVDSIQNLHDPALPPSAFIEKKEALRKNMMESGKPPDIAKMLETVMGMKLSKERKRYIESLSDALEKSITKRLPDDASGDYTNEVTMPGIILSTNARTVEGNTVQWKFDGEAFTLEDYTMSVESRVANPWATYVTAGGVVVIVVVLVITRLRRAG